MLEKAARKTYDIVVVPGVPFEDGTWSRVMKARVLWAKYLYEKGITKNIMFSGSAVYTPYIEAEVMKRYAVSLGIPEEHIFTETKAEHSTENIYYGYKKSKLLKFENIALASDPFQSKMLRKFAHKKISKDIGIIPIVFDTLAKIDTDTIDPVIDTTGLFIHNFAPITERESFGKRFRGTMGKSIDKDAYSN